jgi:hypothetical protein
MNTVTRIGILLAVFAAGIAIGAYLGIMVTQSRSLADEMAEVAYYSTFLEVQRSKGDDAAYEQALRGYLSILNDRKGRPSVLLSERTNAFDSALTYARLSTLARRRGAIEEASRYLAEASALCPKLGWRECSAESIAAVAQRLDQRGLFGSGKPQ